MPGSCGQASMGLGPWDGADQAQVVHHLLFEMDRAGGSLNTAFLREGMKARNLVAIFSRTDRICRCSRLLLGFGGECGRQREALLRGPDSAGRS